MALTPSTQYPGFYVTDSGQLFAPKNDPLGTGAVKNPQGGLWDIGMYDPSSLGGNYADAIQMGAQQQPIWQETNVNGQQGYILPVGAKPNPMTNDQYITGLKKKGGTSWDPYVMALASAFIGGVGGAAAGAGGAAAGSTAEGTGADLGSAAGSSVGGAGGTMGVTPVAASSAPAAVNSLAGGGTQDPNSPGMAGGGTQDPNSPGMAGGMADSSSQGTFSDPGTAAAPTVDQFGNPIPDSGGNGTPSWLSNLTGGGNGTPSWLSNLTGGGSGGLSLGGLTGSTLPGALALAYANNQPGLDTTQLQNTFDSAAANGPAYTQSVTDPIKQNIASGYGDILQSQANRGIRGSGFGDTAISDFLTAGDRSLANAGATATQSSIVSQGNLAYQIAQLKNQAQQQKNTLFGNAFNILGRGLNPNAYSGLGGLNHPESPVLTGRVQ